LDRISIPILKIGDYLITSPQIAIHDRMAVEFKDEILKRLLESRAKGLVVDVSAIDVVDSFLVRQIAEITSAAKVMGADVVVVGLRPEVAMTLVEMGLSMGGILTARDLERGLELLRKAGKRSG
jgi:rsbT antagonist protein RsbS